MPLLRRFQPLRAFLRRNRVESALLLVAVAAGLVWWFGQPSARLEFGWEVPNAGACFPAGSDDKVVVNLSRKVGWSGQGSLPGSDAGPVRVWDPNTGAERFRFLGEDDPLVWASTSSDGRWLGVEDPRGGLTVWDLATGEQVAALATSADGGRRSAALRNFRFAPAAGLLAYEQSKGQGVALWDLAAGRARVDVPGARAPFEFAPDGQTLAGAGAGSVVALWDVTTGRERWRLAGASRIRQIAFSPTGHLLAAEHAEHTDWETSPCQAVSLWETTTGRPWAHIPRVPAGRARLQYFHPLTFSPDGRILILSGAAGEPSLWDVSHRPPTPLDASLEVPVNGTRRYDHPEPHFSPDGRWLVVPGPKEGVLHVLETATRVRRSVLRVRDDGYESSGLRFSPDGRTVAVQVDYRVPVYGNRGRWTPLDAFLPRQVIAQRQVMVLRLFDVASGRSLGEVPGGLWGGFAPDGGSVLAAIADSSGPSGHLLVRRWTVPPDRTPVRRAALGVFALCLLALAARLHRRMRTRVAEAAPAG
jgi:WD40 repeat protein